MTTRKKKRTSKATSDDELSVAVVQCALGDARELNVARVVGHIRDAAELGARIVLPPELFHGPYFPSGHDEAHFAWAEPADNPTLRRFCALAKELDVVIPYSFFERAGQAYYNSLAMIDATGEVLGVYRKAHIPEGPGYHEKFFFRPGDTPITVWDTRHGRIGVGICWDQWFPELARVLSLRGAEILLYPTAIGSEPRSGERTKEPWQRVMVGHAVANSIPVAAANRIGDEGKLVFYGASFLCDPRGNLLGELGPDESGVLVHAFDRVALAERRASWGFFRDRRPDLYRALLAADGTEPSR
ncbi:MAG: N-carbamoylputrescine amidase [Sandaracinaceae bacterium]|nr:N-carbamoylputrescine amidase [Sandaracinaceae bacterium]